MKNPSDNSTIVANTSEEKELFTIMFEQSVGLKRVWCLRCLDNGKKSLEVFVTLMTENQILKSTFIESAEKYCLIIVIDWILYFE